MDDPATSGAGNPIRPYDRAFAAAGAKVRRRIMLAGVVAAALMICAVAVGTLTDWFGVTRSQPPNLARPAATAATSAAPEPLPSSSPANAETGAAVAETSSAPAAVGQMRPSDTVTETARPKTGERQKVSREKNASDKATAAALAPAPTPNAAPVRPEGPTPDDPKTITVRLFVDEQGRVTQAAVASSRPGMESYEASALRVARQRRYPPGKSGWVTVHIKSN